MLVVVAIGFVIFARGHPEMSFPWSVHVTHILYGVYVDIVMLLIVLAFWQKMHWTYIMAVILELGAVFFLVQSMLTVFSEGQSNWYLPMALGMNCIALFINAIHRKNNVKDE